MSDWQYVIVIETGKYDDRQVHNILVSQVPLPVEPLLYHEWLASDDGIDTFNKLGPVRDGTNDTSYANAFAHWLITEKNCKSVVERWVHVEHDWPE